MSSIKLSFVEKGRLKDRCCSTSFFNSEQRSSIDETVIFSSSRDIAKA